MYEQDDNENYIEIKESKDHHFYFSHFRIVSIRIGSPVRSCSVVGRPCSNSMCLSWPVSPL